MTAAFWNFFTRAADQSNGSCPNNHQTAAVLLDYMEKVKNHPPRA
jgi:hypothetical protein